MTEHEHCFAIEPTSGSVCTREAGHPISVGHYSAEASGGIGWVGVPENVLRGLSKCKHGKPTVFDPDDMHDVPMAAPYFWCECCLQLTYYLTSSFMTFDVRTGEAHGSRTMVDTTTCADCGGKSWTETF